MASKEITENTLNYRNIEAFKALHSMECALVGDIESLTISEIEEYASRLRGHAALGLLAD
jgi:hypothetical protein